MQEQIHSNSFINLTDYFCVGDNVTGSLHANHGESGKGFRDGTVIYVSPYFVTVNFGCFNECFNGMEMKEGKIRRL